MTPHALASLGVVAAAVGVVLAVGGAALAVSARGRADRALSQCAFLLNGGEGNGRADPRAVRGLGLIRYDALEEMSGQLSFSVALLNGLGDGVVMSSINGRSETRTYAKAVTEGQGEQVLSPEEEEAVHAARLAQEPVAAVPAKRRRGSRASLAS